MREMDGEEEMTYDVDMLKIRNLKYKWLPYLTYGLVDLSGREPYVKEFIKTQEDLGFCVVCAQIYIFIPSVKRIDFSEALLESVGERFLPVSGDHSRFLHCGPRKCHIEHVMAALSRARIPMVNIYTFSCKSAVEHFLFLDDINAEATVEVDLGFYIRGKPGNIGLVRPRPGSKFPNGTVGKLPILASVQRK